MNYFVVTVILIQCFVCGCKAQEFTPIKSISFELEQANLLAELPLECIQKEYPNKLGQTLANPYELGQPGELHPAFYGCFDWHSSVHGHWSLVTLVNTFPQLKQRAEIIELLSQQLTEHNIQAELQYFQRETEKSFERTYGWAWLLQLQLALNESTVPEFTLLANNLLPLTDYISHQYSEFLPNLIYPIRVGEHSNTAFGLSFAIDYAKQYDTELYKVIEQRAKEFYAADANCPIDWEPSGYDFLSPCLQEIDVMRKIYRKEEFLTWIQQFLPELLSENFSLEVGIVGDRTDGKLVHLDGLNFSRAWVFQSLINQYPKEFSHLQPIVNKHISYSYPNLVGDSYEGGHWLASFAIYALLQ